MARPTRIDIDTQALLHNVAMIKKASPKTAILAMVKANAYGCGLANILPVLADRIDAFGVSCLEEALAVRRYIKHTPCLLLEGFFTIDELDVIDAYQFQLVLHQAYQLEALVAKPLQHKIKIWLKIDTGMHRLGFLPEEIADSLAALRACTWVDQDIGIMSHFACADEPDNPANQEQISCYQKIIRQYGITRLSFCNSAGIFAFPEQQGAMIRPGIMLYGVSPFSNQIAADLGLKPVMHFKSAIIAIKHYPSGVGIGYGAAWRTARPSIIAVAAVGYGDGYPRHIAANTPVMIRGQRVPIVGRVSMDMITIDITDLKPSATIGDEVELWGKNIPIEEIAHAAHTIAYELLCQMTQRPYRYAG